MLRVLPVAVILLMLELGCGIGPTSTESTAVRSTGTACPTASSSAVSRTIESDGVKRRFLVLKPASLPRDRQPGLIVALHGFSDGPETMQLRSRLDAEAARLGLVVVYPEGILSKFSKIGLETPGFNSAPDLFGDSGVDDVSFIRRLIDQVQKDCATAPGATFVTGLSGGAMMAYRLACELPDRITAIATVSGPMGVPCSANRPVSILHIHGSADTISPINGGSSDQFGVLPSVSQGLERWRQIDGCPATPQTLAVAAGEIAPQSALRQAWTPCQVSTEVVFYTIEGGGHGWPPGGARLIAEYFMAHSRH